MVDILFSTPVISSLLVAGCAAFGVSVVVRYMPDRRKLDRTMSRAEKALEKMRRRIATKEATITQLQAEVKMLQPLYERLSDYHEHLTEMRLELERKDMAEEAKNPDGDDDDDDVIGRRKRPKI